MRRVAFSPLAATAALAAAATLAIAQELPYRVAAGKADALTLDGFAAFIANCSSCHGPDALGTSAAPNMLPGVKAMTLRDFAALVRDGRKSEATPESPAREMPAFAKDLEVAPRIDALYTYLRARADGALEPGRPQKLE